MPPLENALDLPPDEQILELQVQQVQEDMGIVIVEDEINLLLLPRLNIHCPIKRYA
jgi:hypothetical protein